MKKRTFFDKIANRFGYIKRIALSSMGALELPSWPNRKTVDFLTAYKSWVYACVKARANDVARIELRLHKIKNRNTGEVEEIMEHDVLSLLRTVNPWQTFRDLIYGTQAYIDLAGEAFWYLDKLGTPEDDAKKRKIKSIWMLRPDYITIKTDSKKFITGYWYTVPGNTKISIPIDQLIHFKEFNPLDPYRGLGVVQAAAMAVDTDDFAQIYNRKFFTNSAIPSVILSTDQKLDDDTIKRMRAQWQNEYGGKDKAHRVAIMEGGLDIKPFSLSQKEMEFLGGRGFTRDEILALFQTPKSVLGMTEDVTVSNAEATDIIFAKRVVKPLMEKMRDVLNEFLLTQYEDGEDLIFTFDDPIPVDKKEKLERYKILHELGAISSNEIRVAEGLDEIDGLDQFYIAINRMPIVGGGDDDDGEKPIKFVKGKDYIRVPAKNVRQKIRDDITSKITDDVVSAFRKALIIKDIKTDDDDLKQTKYTYEQTEAFHKQLVSKSENFEEQYKNTLVKIFTRQEKETLERFDDVTKALRPKDVEKIIIKLERENKLAAEVLLPIIKGMVDDAGNDTLDFLGLDELVFDTTEASVLEFNKVTALKGIKGLNKTTKSKLRKVLSFGIGEGQSIPEITRAIKGVYKEATSKRAQTIARTEILKAANKGSLEAMRQSQIVAGKEWFTALDEKVCEWCGPMHGKIKRLETNYFNQGESFMGRKGGIIKFGFDDIEVPPLHPRCRCTLIPIVSGTRSTIPLKKTVEMPTIDREELKKELKEEIESEVFDELEKTLNE